MKKFLIILLALGITLVVLGFVSYRYAFAPTESSIATTPVPQTDEIQVVASGLTVPWDVAQLPEGDLLVTERTGDLLRIDASGAIERLTVPQVAPAGEGVLMGLVLHPN